MPVFMGSAFKNKVLLKFFCHKLQIKITMHCGNDKMYINMLSFPLKIICFMNNDIVASPMSISIPFMLASIVSLSQTHQMPAYLFHLLPILYHRVYSHFWMAY